MEEFFISVCFILGGIGIFLLAAVCVYSIITFIFINQILWTAVLFRASIVGFLLIGLGFSFYKIFKKFNWI